MSWQVDRDAPDVASPLPSGGRLYFYKGKSGLLTCVDAKTGKPHYTAQRLPGISSTYASPITAGGYVYLTDRSGAITVIKDSDQLEIVSTNNVGEPVDATPAPVDNQLFVRSENSLFRRQLPRLNLPSSACSRYKAQTRQSASRRALETEFFSLTGGNGFSEYGCDDTAHAAVGGDRPIGRDRLSSRSVHE